MCLGFGGIVDDLFIILCAFCEIITLRLLMVDIGLLGFVTCDLCLVSLFDLGGLFGLCCCIGVGLLVVPPVDLVWLLLGCWCCLFGFVVNCDGFGWVCLLVARYVSMVALFAGFIVV